MQTLSLPSPEDINAQIVRSIAGSAIGKCLNDEITRRVGELSTSYNNPIAHVVQDEITKIIREVIANQYRDKIIELVKAKVTEQFTGDLIDKFWETWRNRNL